MKKPTKNQKKRLDVAPQTIRVLTTELEVVTGGGGIGNICSRPASTCQDAC